jgi:hypothetical protein
MNLTASLSSNNLSTSSAIIVNSGATLGVTGLTLGAIALTSGQTLGGNGTVNGGVNANLGNIAPGASIGTLTTGSLSMGNASSLTIEADLSSPVVNGVVSSDVLAVNGTVQLDGTLILSLTGDVGGGKTVLLINNDDDADAGIAVATNFDAVTGVSGLDYTILTAFNATNGSETGGNDVAIKLVSAVPEPASASLVLLAAGGLMRRRRAKSV